VQLIALRFEIKTDGIGKCAEECPQLAREHPGSTYPDRCRAFKADIRGLERLLQCMKHEIEVH